MEKKDYFALCHKCDRLTEVIKPEYSNELIFNCVTCGYMITVKQKQEEAKSK